MIVFNYGLLFVRDRRKNEKEYVEQATSKYGDYKYIRSQIKAKAKERGKLQKELAVMSVFAISRRKELESQIAELSEEIEELQFEEKSIMQDFGKADAAEMKKVEGEISKSEVRIIDLDAQEVEFAGTISLEKEKFDRLKAQVADLDQDELADARLALRPQLENEGRERISKGTPDGRISFVKYQAAVRDTDRTLNQDDMAERREGRERLWRMEERQRSECEVRKHQER